MLRLRLVVPADRTGAVLARVRDDPGVAHVALLRGASVEPPGDIVVCDVAREAANELVEWLQARSIHHDGAISVGLVDTVISDAAARAEAEAPGHGADALIWETLEARAREDAVCTPSFLVLMAVAAGIAAIGIILDSPVLIIGAMVVGPDYGPVAAICVAVVRSRSDPARTAALTLASGVAVGIVAATALTGLLRLLGIVPSVYEIGDRELTAFIARPDALSFVVAVLAGVAGMLSLTQGRSGALIGVLVSVTTIPAIANIGLAAAYRAGPEISGSAIQLLLNITGLLGSGIATLAVQQRLTRARASGQ